MIGTPSARKYSGPTASNANHGFVRDSASDCSLAANRPIHTLGPRNGGTASGETLATPGTVAKARHDALVRNEVRRCGAARPRDRVRRGAFSALGLAVDRVLSPRQRKIEHCDMLGRVAHVERREALRGFATIGRPPPTRRVPTPSAMRRAFAAPSAADDLRSRSAYPSEAATTDRNAATRTTARHRREARSGR